MDLPTTSSSERMGVTMSCSSVPNSRSRAIIMLANMAAMAAAMKPSSDGIMKLDSFKSSLNQTRRLISSGMPPAVPVDCIIMFWP